MTRRPVVVFEDTSLLEAADLMVREGVGRLPVVNSGDRSALCGIVTRSDLLSAHAVRLDHDQRVHPPVNLFVRRAR